jgi:hypothetical protein
MYCSPFFFLLLLYCSPFFLLLLLLLLLLFLLFLCRHKLCLLLSALPPVPRRGPPPKDLLHQRTAPCPLQRQELKGQAQPQRAAAVGRQVEVEARGEGANLKPNIHCWRKPGLPGAPGRGRCAGGCHLLPPDAGGARPLLLPLTRLLLACLLLLAGGLLAGGLPDVPPC